MALRKRLPGADHDVPHGPVLIVEEEIIDAADDSVVARFNGPRVEIPERAKHAPSLSFC